VFEKKLKGVLRVGEKKGVADGDDKTSPLQPGWGTWIREKRQEKTFRKTTGMNKGKEFWENITAREVTTKRREGTVRIEGENKVFKEFDGRQTGGPEILV